MLSTRREWCGRVSLPIPHLLFVSKSLMVSGVLCTLIISSMLPLSRFRNQSPEGCSSEQYGGMYIVQCARVSRWLLQLLMRASDISLTAVSTPSGMIWGWPVMPQGLSNDPATFNRLVKQLFRPHRGYAQTYFDDNFVHSRATNGRTDVDNHIDHLRAILECMRTNNCVQMHLSASLVQKRFPFWGASLGSEAIERTPPR